MNSPTYDELLADGPALISLDERAVRASIDLVSRLTPADLDAPTPCAGWNLRDLLEHLIIQHYGFAAASRGVDDLALWKQSPLSPDPIAEYRAAATHVLSAFAMDGVLDREFPLPEFGDGIVVPARFAISFHFVDYVVHSWDVARTLGLSAEFDDAVIEAALLIAQAVPGGDIRTRPGAAFAPEVVLPEGSGLDRVLALLGRSPNWPH